MNIPTFSQNSDPALRKLDRFIEWFLLTLILCVTLLVCCSCGSTKVVTQTVRDVSVDTVYLSNVQYDSIYIFQDRQLDRSRDTVYLRDVSVEYRYRHLSDTIYKVQHDSIPYQVTVTEVKEITRPLSIFDHLTHFTFWLVIGALLLLIIRVIIRLKKSGTIR